jgi:hypothetical protein
VGSTAGRLTSGPQVPDAVLIRQLSILECCAEVNAGDAGSFGRAVQVGEADANVPALSVASYILSHHPAIL